MEGQIARLVSEAVPALAALRGVGTDTAASLLVAVGDNPQRLKKSEASFALLCGVAPVPLVLLYPIALALSDVGDPLTAATALLFLIIVQAFLAGMAGALKERYWTRSVPPPGA